MLKGPKIVQEGGRKNKKRMVRERERERERERMIKAEQIGSKRGEKKGRMSGRRRRVSAIINL